MIDATDSRLLAALQADAQITAQDLGEHVGLSASQAARRRAKLEADGLIAAQPEVVACWTLTCEADYLLRVWCADLPALNLLIHHRLLPNPAVARVQSQIVMDQSKPDAGLPV